MLPSKRLEGADQATDIAARDAAIETPHDAGVWETVSPPSSVPPLEVAAVVRDEDTTCLGRVRQVNVIRHAAACETEVVDRHGVDAAPTQAGGHGGRNVLVQVKS